MRELLARGADTNAGANIGWTPLYSACLQDHLEVVRELLAHIAPPSLAAQAESALFFSKDNPAIQQLIRAALQLP